MIHRTCRRNYIALRRALPLLLMVAVVVVGCDMLGPEGGVQDARRAIAEDRARTEALPPSPERDDKLESLDNADKALRTAQDAAGVLDGTGSGELFIGLLPPQYAAWGSLALALLAAFRARYNRVAGREVARGQVTPRATQLSKEAGGESRGILI